MAWTIAASRLDNKSASHHECGGATMRDDVRKKIEETVSGSKVVLFMKGTKNFPQCGFSARVVQALKKSGEPFVDVNVLTDPEVREGIKEFSSWPTIPQLYVNGKFVGGCDIVTELDQSGELETLIKS
jgi:monothiol glutaredoxin